MSKSETIVIEGIEVNGNTTPEELLATGKIDLNEDSSNPRLIVKDWIDVFGEKFCGRMVFFHDSIRMVLFPKLDIPNPGHPDADYDEAAYKFCKKVLEENFDNVTYKENGAFVELPEGTITTCQGYDDGKRLVVGGSLDVEIKRNIEYKHVYILTETGRVYTDEGCKVVAEGIKKNFGYDGEIMFVMGEAYNKARNLKRELEDHPGSYVVVSHEKGIDYLKDKNVEGLMRALDDYPDERSWNTVIRFFIDDIDLDNRENA